MGGEGAVVGSGLDRVGMRCRVGLVWVRVGCGGVGCGGVGWGRVDWGRVSLGRVGWGRVGWGGVGRGGLGWSGAKAGIQEAFNVDTTKGL